jgi:hypothetical protein
MPPPVFFHGRKPAGLFSRGPLYQGALIKVTFKNDATTVSKSPWWHRRLACAGGGCGLRLQIFTGLAAFWYYKTCTRGMGLLAVGRWGARASIREARVWTAWLARLWGACSIKGAWDLKARLTAGSEGTEPR